MDNDTSTLHTQSDKTLLILFTVLGHVGVYL